MNKKILSIALLMTAITFLGYGCNSKSDNSRNGGNRSRGSENANAQNQNSSNQNSMNTATADQMPMNHADMDHSNMDHSEMQSSPDAKNAPYDLQFLDTMIAHHQGAVVMSKPAVSKAQHDDLKNLANNISTSQEKEIAQMREWREKWYGGKPLAMNMEFPGMADSMKDMDMKKLESLTGNAFDLAFIEMMIPHHQGAILMAKDALNKAEHPEIKTIAKSIIMAQEDEIKSMQDWKTKWTNQ